MQLITGKINLPLDLDDLGVQVLPEIFSNVKSSYTISKSAPRTCSPLTPALPSFPGIPEGPVSPRSPLGPYKQIELKIFF